MGFRESHRGPYSGYGLPVTTFVSTLCLSISDTHRTTDVHQGYSTYVAAYLYVYFRMFTLEQIANYSNCVPCRLDVHLFLSLASFSLFVKNTFDR
jgi:hypothetical protein